MNAVLAQRNYDRELPVEVASELWEAFAQRVVTDDQVEQFIANLADSGSYEDDLGMYRTAGDLYTAVARQWVHDKEAVGSTIGPAFWQWAKSTAHIAEFGKPYLIQK